MRVENIPIHELSADLKQRWLDVQSTNPFFFGPCFHPELFSSVGRFYPNIFVAVIRQGQEICGFMPFRREPSENCKKIPHCDYDAIICGPEHHWDVGRILRKLGSESWTFGALAGHDNIRPKRGEWREFSAFRIDLSGGFEQYVSSLKHGRIGDADLMRKKRVIERKLGAISFVPDARDPKLIQQLMDWKVMRYKQETDWGKLRTDLFEYIHQLELPSFRGIISALYAGNQVLAINFGIRYQHVLKGMVMSFNPEFEKNSVGQLLLYHLIREYEALDYNVLDFGPGEHSYKVNFTNSELPVIQGTLRIDSLKERVKSIRWLYRSLRPLARMGRKSSPRLS